VATANLVEAEGRALRRGVVQVAVAVAGLLVALGIGLTGAGLLVAALYWGLVEVMHPAWAFLIAGGICAVVAIGVAWVTAAQGK
jgi:hypothetical protein